MTGLSLFCLSSRALSEDIPEEVLRAEIITEARSSLDGSRLTPWEYAVLKEKLKTDSFPPELKPDIRNLIFLLQLRHLIQGIFP